MPKKSFLYANDAVYTIVGCSAEQASEYRNLLVVALAEIFPENHAVRAYFVDLEEDSDSVDVRIGLKIRGNKPRKVSKLFKKICKTATSRTAFVMRTHALLAPVFSGDGVPVGKCNVSSDAYDAEFVHSSMVRLHRVGAFTIPERW